MGLLGFFGFGHDDSAAVHAAEAARHARQSLDIEVSIAAHENWVTRLETYLAGVSHEELDPATVACDDKCALGHWIYGDGDKFLGDYASFNDLKATHKMFHFKASSIISLHQSNQSAAAEEQLHGELNKLSMKIKTRLEDLKMID